MDSAKLGERAADFGAFERLVRVPVYHDEIAHGVKRADLRYFVEDLAGFWEAHEVAGAEDDFSASFGEFSDVFWVCVVPAVDDGEGDVIKGDNFVVFAFFEEWSLGKVGVFFVVLVRNAAVPVDNPDLVADVVFVFGVGAEDNVEVVFFCCFAYAFGFFADGGDVCFFVDEADFGEAEELCAVLGCFFDGCENFGKVCFDVSGYAHLRGCDANHVRKGWSIA